jgi:SEC-C motif
VADDPTVTEGTLPPPSETQLPEYSDEHLSSLENAELWQLLIRNEDRVPRNLIDECARRGEAILDLAANALESERFWTDDQTRGEAWIPVHAVMILGLMPDARAGALLAAYMRRIAGEDDLQDWLGGYWPAFFRNKPAEQVALAKTIAEDVSLHWFMRSEAFDLAVAMAQAQGDTLLDSTLEWVARFAFDEKEDETLQDLLVSTLLDFARPRYRARIEAFADEALVAAYDRDDVERIYAAGGEPPRWTDRPDPWLFYSPEEIAARQRRWAEDEELEDLETGEDEEFVLPPIETYVRAAPKVGRNDPCPCGSGKKYKKCCLEADSQRS